MDLLNGLNESQKAAVIANGNVRVIAGAGSGKTRVLTHRIAYLIEQGIAPYRILAITFTNKAAKEMKERLIRLIGEPAHGCHLSTFHSLCVRVLREDIHVLDYPRNFTIIDGEDQKSLLKEFYKELNIDHKVFSYGSVLSYISRQKQLQRTPEEAIENAGEFVGEKNKARIYQMYIKRQNELFALDFDDLLIKVVDIFNRFEDIKLKWQHRFQYIHVDEFQDTNDIQYQLIKLLSKNHDNVYVVGDPDQTIYTFRGADVAIILDFNKDFKGAQTITLDRNYRSTKAILDGANYLIKNNKNRVEKDLFTTTESEHKIVHYSAVSEEVEADYISGMINQIINEVEDVNYEDFAVLYRANYLSRSVEQSLIRHQIEYRIFGGLKFFERKEIKDLLCYLRLIVNRKDDLALQRVINVPRRGVGNKGMETIINAAQTYRMSLYEVLFEHLDDIQLTPKVKKELAYFVNTIEKYRDSDLVVHRIFELMLADIGYLDMIQEDQDISRLDNINELKIGMMDYDKRTDEEEASLDHYLQEVALYTSQDTENQNPHFVSLMTIHMAKGLEFKYVFVVGLSENIFPSIRSLEEGYDGLEEERRLAYVAFTRAKERLFLTDSQGYSFVSNSQKTASRFIDELGEYVEHQGVYFNKNKRKEIMPDLPKFQKQMPTNNVTDWQVGEQVVHAMFGEGVILKVNKDVLEIAFSLPHGVKVLMANHGALSKK